MKLAVIGGGSTYTPELIDGIIKRNERLPITEIYLLDITTERVSVIAAFASRMLKAAGKDISIQFGTNLDEAIKVLLDIDLDDEDDYDEEEDEEFEAGEVDPANVQMLDVGSPFDFANQGVLYLPREIPEPTRDGPTKKALVELGELIEAAGGRTLALFSSWRAVEKAAEHLQRALPEAGLHVNLLVQQKGDVVADLVKRFSRDTTDRSPDSGRAGCRAGSGSDLPGEELLRLPRGFRIGRNRQVTEARLPQTGTVSRSRCHHLGPCCGSLVRFCVAVLRSECRRR